MNDETLATEIARALRNNQDGLAEQLIQLRGGSPQSASNRALSVRSSSARPESTVTSASRRAPAESPTTPATAESGWVAQDPFRVSSYRAWVASRNRLSTTG